MQQRGWKKYADRATGMLVVVVAIALVMGSGQQLLLRSPACS